MWKKIGITVISLLSTISVVYSMNQKLLAEQITYATGISVGWNQFSKISIDGKSYTALSNSGAFIADENSTITGVGYNIEKPVIEDIRVTGAIISSGVSLADLNSVIDGNGILNNKIVAQPTWWLTDKQQVNGVASALVVDADNSTKNEMYNIGNSNWNGSLPIVDSPNKLNVRENYPLSGTSTSIANGPDTTYYLCNAIFKNGVALPCDDETNPEKEYIWTSSYGQRAGMAELIEVPTKALRITPITNWNQVQPGKTILIGELRWPTGEASLSGDVLMVIGPSQTKVSNSNTILGANSNPIWTGSSDDNLLGTVLFDDIMAQNAQQRLKLNLNSDDIAYVTKSDSTVTTASQLASLDPISTMLKDVVYHLHLKDSSIKINKLKTTDDVNNVVDTSNNTISVGITNTTVKIPFEMSELKTGYTRYLSAYATDKNDNEVYGKIASFTSNLNSEATLDISNLMNVATVGDTMKVKLFIEDVKTDNTSYMSDPYEITIKIFDNVGMTYTPVSSTFTYGDNVKKDNTIGTINLKSNSIASGFKLEAPSEVSSEHENDYKNFEIKKNSATSYDIIVYSDATDIVTSSDSLKAKEYFFRLVPLDSGGNALPLQYIDKSIDVKKSTPTLSFVDPNAKDIEVGDDLSLDVNQMYTSFIGITQSDISYTLTGGAANVLNVSANETNPLQYDLSFSPLLNESVLPTILTLNAKINGNENYNDSVSVSRNVYVYKGLSELRWTPKNNTYLPSDCTTGKGVGELLAVNGVGPYKYKLTPASSSNDNGAFSVASDETAAGTAVDVTTKSNLTAGTYNLEFEVTDSKNDTKTKTAQIIVQANTQTGFKWKDAAGGSEITSVEFEYGIANKKIVAEGGQSSEAVVYDLAPQDMQPNGVTDASSYVKIEPTSGLLTFKKTGTIKVMATRPSNATYAESKIYMDLKIKQRAQNIVFNSNTVNKVQVGNKSIIDATGSIVNGGGNGVGGIWYDSSDKNFATVDPTTGEVTGVAAGTTTLTAVLNKESTDGYTNSNYNSNYETKTITKQISIYTPMTFTYNDSDPKVKANANKKGDIVGSITVSNKAGAAPLKAQISTLDTQENADKLYFMEPVVNGNIVTLKLNKTIDAQAHASHNGGTFKVQVIIADENGPQTFDVVALVEEADNTVSFTDVDGNDITELTRMFDDTGNVFNLTSKSSSNSSTESVRYSAVDSSQDILQVTATGAVTVLKAGSTKVKVSVGSSNGYGDAAKEMLVTINPATQTIKFDDTTDPFKIELNGGSKSQKATGKVVLSNATQKTGVGDITYKSSDPAIASIDENGMVSAVSVGQQIEITATINDVDTLNYNANYKTESCTKKVQVFTGKNVSFDKETPNLKANTSIANEVVGTITTQNTMGPISYIKVTGDDSDLFVLEDNGLTANVKFNESATISASDLFTHGKNYKFKVNVTDDNGITPCLVSITIDEAEDEITFKKGGSAITKISELYGTNNNQLPIIAVTKSGNTPVYNVIGDQNIIEIPSENVGQATIKKAGTTTVEVSVSAAKGYAAYKKSIVVEIGKGEQWIAFEDDKQTHAFVKDETFPAKAILTEISEGTVSSRSITYTSLTPAICRIEPSDRSGNVTMLTMGECTINAKNEDDNWSKASIEKTILLYDGLGATFTQDKALQAETGTAQATSLVGKISASGGVAPITYAVSTSTSGDNADAGFFNVNSTSGVISLNKEITAADLNGKYVESKKAYVLHVNFTATDGDKNVATAGNKEVLVKGAPLTGVEIDTKGTGRITKEYVAQDGDFLVNVLNYQGTGNITYQVKQGLDQNVISISDGIVSILNANEAGREAVLLEAIIPASDGYDTKSLECEIEITQAKQPFKFKREKVDLPLESRIDLAVEGILAKDTEGNLLDWAMISKETGKLSVNNHTVISKSSEGEVIVKASVKGDRNYQAASAEMKVNITSKPAYSFEIAVPEVTYGDSYDEDNPLVAEIFSDHGVGVKTRTWESNNPNVASIDENGHITIVNAGEATISCTQSIPGQPDVTSTAKITINKKEITVTIENASKYVGEMVPMFHAIIPNDELVIGDVIEQPLFSCKDATTPVNEKTKVGSYDITGTYLAQDYPNYSIKITPAKLTIKQDTSLANWFHLVGATSGNDVDGTTWVNEDVNVVLNSVIESAGTYDEISLDEELWSTSHMVSSEGIMNINAYFRIQSTKALASPQSITMKIDKTKPVIKSITGTAANRNAIEELLHTITFGKYFKPELEVNIQAEDVLPSGVSENSGLKSIYYDAYQIKDDDTLSDAIVSGEMKPTDSLKLVDEGRYLICATAQDHSGNTSTESCSGIMIREIGDDSDDDGIPDLNIDTNGDGIPNINITEKEGDKKPWINIDTNGDGIAEMNIDIDENGTPDLNTGIVMEYKANIEVDLDKDGKVDYKTDNTLFGINNIDSDEDTIPDINIDLELDGIPELNIDTNQDFDQPEIDIDGNGDGVKNINVDTNDDGIADKNVLQIPTWIPDIDVEVDNKIRYNTMHIEYEIKDSLEDNGVIVKPSDPGHTFLPNYALKVNDVTKDIDEETKKSIIEIIGDKGELKHVFDVSLSDGEKTIQPDGSIVVRIPVDQTIKNPRILIRNEAGNFEEIEMNIEDGYYVFETNFLGQVSIVGDIEEVMDGSDSDLDKDTSTANPPKLPQSSVQGSYTAGTGGAATGDESNVISLILMSFYAIVTLKGVHKKIYKEM